MGTEAGGTEAGATGAGSTEAGGTEPGGAQAAGTEQAPPPAPAPFRFTKIVVCGVGLIGGSLARALRRAGRAEAPGDPYGAYGAAPSDDVAGAGGAGSAGDIGGTGGTGGLAEEAARETRGGVGGELRPAHARGEIVGVGRGIAAVERAIELGVVDSGCTFDDVAGLAHALDGADLVVLAAPVAQTRALLDVMIPHLQLQTIVTDAGSTKGDVIAAARASLGSRIGQFVPAHPIAGRELSGIDAAIEDLYDARNVVLCPLPENTEASVTRVEAMWRACGARLHRMSAQQHDTVFASVSHLPHLLSFALVDQILDSDEAGLKFSFAAGGFRDFTRIAASNPEMWRDICLANRPALLAELDGYTAVLARLRAAIERGDGEQLNAVFSRARDARERWSDRPEAHTQAGQHAAPGQHERHKLPEARPEAASANKTGE
jgi:prephenate dehydrogenase